MAWEEIHGFNSPGEFKRFQKYLSGQIDTAEIEEINVDPDYESGQIFGGRWFLDVESGDVWRLVEPDFPFRGLWEPVDKN